MWLSAPSAPSRGGTGTRARRYPRRAVLIGALVVGILAFAARVPLLQAMGRTLIVDEPLQQSDVIVIAIDAQQGAGVLEAADLYRQGIAPVVAVSGTVPSLAEVELRRRGLPYEDGADLAVKQLRLLQVRAERLPVPVTGTSDQGRALAEWCSERGCRSAIVITNAEHSRRLRRVLRRALEGSPVRATVRVSRYMSYDVHRWWQTRRGVHATVEEFGKLALDVMRHPLP